MTTVFIISAPSGSGKSTLVSRLLAGVPGLLFSVSYTTRALRGQEVDGQSYRFVRREDFERMIAGDEFLEWAQVFGNYYGTHRGILEQAQATGCDLILDIDDRKSTRLNSSHTSVASPCWGGESCVWSGVWFLEKFWGAGGGFGGGAAAPRRTPNTQKE